MIRRNYRKFCSGFSLVELILASVISSILVLAIGIPIVSGTRAWLQTYNAAHKQLQDDAVAITTKLGIIGRKSNRVNYIIYNKSGSAFNPAIPATSQETVVSGNAVEFRYWDVPLDAGDTHNLMDVTKTATAYAFLYLDGSLLKVDTGPYPPGAVPAGGGARNTANVTTTVLARNVSADPNSNAFSHTTLSSIGKGCVRVNVTLTDPNTNEQIKVMTSVLMRNIWPR